jgi:hypothetical protein
VPTAHHRCGERRAYRGAARSPPSTSLLDVFGYLGLFLATVLLLRALITVLRDQTPHTLGQSG